MGNVAGDRANEIKLNPEAGEELLFKAHTYVLQIVSDDQTNCVRRYDAETHEPVQEVRYIEVEYISGSTAQSSSISAASHDKGI